jgi:hypothetical protein
MHRVLVSLVALTCSLPCPTMAARSLSADQTITIRLEPSQPTAIALPEPVASVSVGMAPDKFSLDYDGPYLFLLPLDPTITGRLFVVGQSGKLYTITFKVTTPADDVVHITATPAGATAKTQPFSVASFLRALRTGAPIPGQQAVDVPSPSLPDTRLTLLDATALAVGSMVGLTLTVRNTQATPLTLDLRIGAPSEGAAESMVALSTWTWPPRMTIKAVAADAEMVPSDGQSRLFVIFEKRP